MGAPNPADKPAAAPAASSAAAPSPKHVPDHHARLAERIAGAHGLATSDLYFCDFVRQKKETATAARERLLAVTRSALITFVAKDDGNATAPADAPGGGA